MQFPSLTPTVETSSVIHNISSSPSAGKPRIDVVPLLAITSIQPSPSIVKKKVGKERGLRTRGGRKNNFSTRSVPVTRQFPGIPSCSKGNRKRHCITSDSSDSSDNNKPVDIIISVDDPSSADEFIWDDNTRGKHQFTFSGTPDIKVQAEDIDSPLSVLKTFITKEMVSDIVKYKNSYAEIMINHPKIQERMKQSARSLFHLWEE